MLDEGLQPFLVVREAAVVEIERVYGATERLDLNARRIGLGLAQILGDARGGDARQQAEDQEHHHELQQRETSRPHTPDPSTTNLFHETPALALIAFRFPTRSCGARRLC